MLFQTPEFLLFIISVLLLYWGILRGRRQAQNIMLLVASYIFYGWWDWHFLGLIFFSTVVDYICGLYLDQRQGEQETEYLLDAAKRKRVLIVSLVCNLGLLGFFKYYNFFTESLASSVWVMFGYEFEPWFLDIAVPVGISFYTFQSLSYTIDIYRGKLRSRRSFLDFALFVAIFPQLVAGPIVRAKEMLPQIEKDRRFHLETAQEGLWLILWGLVKKVVIADNIAKVTDTLYNPDVFQLGSPLALAAAYAFTVQIYCDFSGYTDIARGTARLLGFELPLNFRLPFFAKNPSDLWERWHITLSSWLRDYLYISLGGNRKGASWTYFNLMATMVLGGLWHGANDNFITWGFYHGLVLVVYRVLALRGLRWPMENTAVVLFFRRLVMFHLWCIGCTIFRSTSSEHAFRIISDLFTFTAANETVMATSVAFERLAFFAGPLILFQLIQFRTNNLDVIFRWPWPIRGVIYAVLLIWMIIFGNFHGQEFYYFQF